MTAEYKKWNLLQWFPISYVKLTGIKQYLERFRVFISHNRTHDVRNISAQLAQCNYLYQFNIAYTGAKKPLSTIHLVTTMLTTSKNVLFPDHSHLLTTGAADPSL